MISLNQIPASLRTPGAYVEFDASKAISGLPAAPKKILLIGLRLATGTTLALTPLRCVNQNQVTAAFGRGSMLDRMFRAARAGDSTTEIWAVALNEAGGGAAATGTITVTGTATAAGSIALMIAGQRVPVGIAVGDTATVSAGKIVAAVNALPDLPVTAANAAGVVTLTARHKGTNGNEIDVRANYYQGEALPTGLALAFAAMANGATNPDVATVFTALGDGEHWPTIISGFNDAANLTVIETELASRWGPLRMIEGLGWAAVRGNYAASAALGAARNSFTTTLLGTGLSPTPTWEAAAVYGAVASAALAIDPARPVHTLALPGFLPPEAGARFTRAERELLLNDGISTYTVDASGVASIERAITTYQTDAFGLENISWLDVNTPATLAYLRLAVRSRILQKYPRHKLANDGTQFARGQAIVTPALLRAELFALFRELELAGLVEDFDQFKTDLIVERDASDPNRVNALIPPNIVNQFRVFGARVEFRL